MTDDPTQLSRALGGVTDQISRLETRVRGDLSSISKDSSVAREHSVRADQGIKALETSFEQLYGILHAQFTTVIERLEHLQKLPDLFEGLEQTIHREFETSFLHQFEGQILGHQGRVLGNRSRIEAYERLVERKREQLGRELGRVRERYGELLRTVATHNETRRRSLDSHAYELIERVYPAEIQERFSHVSLPAYEYLAAHASESALVRNQVFVAAVKSLREAVSRFLDQYRTAKAELRSWLAEDLEPGRYTLGLTVAEIEDRTTGERRFEIRDRSGRRLPEEAEERVAVFLRGSADRFRGDRLSGTERSELAELLEARGVPREELDRFRSDPILSLGTQ
ncbi:MAG: hypothetical protein PVG07_01595 [Acidobacteriota bacterium]|jgi:hypothetical protein